MKIAVRPGRLLNISFHENKDSNTTVFLIHGFGGRGAQWRNQIKILKKHYSLVIPDLFGLGESDKPRPFFSNPYRFSELDQDIHAIFSRYANKNNIVIGHSYGGALAVSLAFDYRDTVNKLILIDPTSAEPKAQLPAIFNYPAFVLQLIRSRLEKAFNQGGYDPSTSPQLIEEENIESRKNRMDVIKAMANGMKTVRFVDVSQLPMPVLILMGETDKIIPPASIKAFYGKIPHHEIHVIPKAAHMVMLEQPEKTNELIMAFLR